MANVLAMDGFIFKKNQIMSRKLDLSIIVVNFNTKTFLKGCLDSLNKNTKNISYEIIIVDNASNDGSVDLIKKYKVEDSKIKTIFNDTNLGFAKANNLGIDKAQGRYILLLNSDTQVNSNVLEDFVSWMDEHQEVGVSSCCLVGSDGKTQSNGGYFPNILRVGAWMLFVDDIPLVSKLIKPFHPKPSGEATQIDWVTGAFMFIRAGVIGKIGCLDERYFMYVEDVDFCMRANLAGYTVWYLPKMSILHFGGASSNSEYSLVSEYKNIKIFYKKHYVDWQFPLLRFFLFVGAILRIFVLGILTGSRSVKIYVNAIRQI